MFAGLSDLLNQLDASDGEAVTYTQGATSLAGVLALVGQSEFEEVGGDGALVSRTTTDFLIAAGELSGLTPQRGDRITRSLGNRTLVYEVLPPGGAPPWRWSDPGQTRRRIHTKLISDS
jgi:hypothetical protein